MTDDNILRKVRALLELARNNTNVNEAAAAAAKANELMVLYNLDLTQSKQTEGRNRKKFAGGLYKWQRTLWEQVAGLHFCMYWSQRGLTKGSQYEHQLLGREVNVASAQVLAEYLEEAINRFVRTRFGSDPKLYFSSAANKYREGMVETLQWRLYEKRLDMKAKEKAAREAQGGVDTTNALVVTIGDVEREEHWANVDAMNNWEPGTAKARDLKWREDYEARAKAAREADELLKASDPEAWQAKEDAKKKAQEEWHEKCARQARRRKVKEEAPEKAEGRADGYRISLDQQVDEAPKPKLL